MGAVTAPQVRIKIEHDPDHKGPRVEHDNLGVMHCAHRRYTLGDKGAPTPFVNDDWWMAEVRPDVLFWLPIYLYDHGGITVSHSPFDCQWDSGLLGWHYITKAVADENWPNATHAEQIAYAGACLEAELKEYDAYLQGEVYGFQIFDAVGDEVNGCWGFIGDDIETNGMLEHIPESLHALAREAWGTRHA